MRSPSPFNEASPIPDWLVHLVHDDPVGWSDWLDTFPDLNSTDNDGMTPLHWACFLQRPRVVHELLLMGADPWRGDHGGLFPWQLAMLRPAHAGWDWDRWPDRYPAAFSRRDPHDPWNSACLARAVLQAAQDERLDMVRALTLASDVRDCPGVPVTLNRTDDPWRWFLLPWAHAVVLRNLDTAFPLLHAWGIDLNDTDPDGRTAVQWAIALQQPVMADLLIDAGARLIEPDDEPLVVNEQADRPDPVSLAMILSPGMANWVGQRLPAAEGSGQERLAQEVWDMASEVHGVPAMVQATMHGWKQRFARTTRPR